MPKLWSTCGAKMHRLKEKSSRRLHRSRHEEPAADNQSTPPDCKQSDHIEPAKELSQRSTSVSSKPPITNRSQHEGAVPRSLPEKRRSLSTSNTRGEVSSVKGETETSDPSLPEFSQEPGGDENICPNLWKEAFEKLHRTTQDHLRELGYEPSLDTNQGELDILLKDLRTKMKLCDEKNWEYNGKLVRDYAAKCATWVKWIGDLVMPFAPSQVAGPWGLIKVALEIPIEYNDAMFALLGTVERVLHATFRGREYESTYATKNSDIVDTLRGDLVNVYGSVLEILSYSIKMLKKSTWSRMLDMMFDKSSGRFSDLTTKEDELARTAQACSAATGVKTSNDLQDIRRRLPRIETQVMESLEELKSDEVLNILEWISPIQYGAHHDTVSGNRTPGTGEWLLQKDEFRDWEESSSSAVLWLRGPPGTGKTFLTSRVIDHVKSTLARVPNDEGFAYFYCYRNEDIRTRPLAVARSYVRQLSANESKTNSNETDLLYIRSRLRSKYRYLRTHASDLGLKDCEELLTESVNLYPRTTLVLDAFDECDPASRGELLQLFKKLLSSSKRPVKLFIASRPDGDIQQQVRSHPNIEVKAADNHQDIQAHISQEMFKLIGKNSAFGELRDTVESTLSEKSQGMFQWTSLQLKQLEKCVSAEAILECLQTLPRTLDDTYGKLLKEIEDSPPHDRDLALRALKWVLAAREPLSRKDLLEAVRINPDLMTTHLCTPISDDALLALCRNLLVIDSERDVWNVSHLSVAEYLELRCSWTNAINNLMVGKACLLFMLSDTCWNMDMYEPDPHPWDLKSNFKRPLTYYLSRHWPEHIGMLDPAGLSKTELSPAIELLEQFLGAPQDSSAQYQVWAQCYHEFTPIGYSILAVCDFGLYQVSDSWWNIDQLNLAKVTHEEQTYMTRAASKGHIPIMRILLAKGGTVGEQGLLYKSTPLIEAAYNGHVEVVKFLLEEWNVDVNLEVSYGWSPRTCALVAAVSQRQFDMVQFLVLEAHADVNKQVTFSPYGSILAGACYYNWFEGTEFLVEHGGADIDMVLRRGDYGSALASAVQHGCSETVRYLVEVKRGNVNLPLFAGWYGSALETAAFKGDEQVVQYLIEVGQADVNMPLPRTRRRTRGTVLARVAFEWSEFFKRIWNKGKPNPKWIFQILLAAGAWVILDVGNGEIVDAIEAFHGRIWPKRRCGDTYYGNGFSEGSDGNDEDQDGKFDEDNADDEFVKHSKAYARTVLADLHKEMWQQYDSGVLGIEEARYVEAKYGQERAQTVSVQD